MLIRRSLRERAKGARHYELASLAVKMAMTSGLQPGQQVEIETADDAGQIQKEVYELVDNFTGDKAFAGAYAKHYEIKVVPKSRREPKPDTGAAGSPGVTVAP
jgi:hypothetical protein